MSNATRMGAAPASVYNVRTAKDANQEAQVKLTL